MLSIPCPIFFKVDWIYATCNQQVSVCPFFFDTVSQNYVSLPLFIYSVLQTCITKNLINFSALTFTTTTISRVQLYGLFYVVLMQI